MFFYYQNDVLQVGNFGAQSLIPAGNQLAPAAAKACVQGQMLSSKSTAVIQGQSAGFIPATTSANQTVVISQLISNPQSVLPHQAKAITDGQKGKSYVSHLLLLFSDWLSTLSSDNEGKTF